MENIMKISKLIEELEREKKEHGDIEVMTTHVLEPEDGKNVFRTTVDTVIVDTGYRVFDKRKEVKHIYLTI